MNYDESEKRLITEKELSKKEVMDNYVSVIQLKEGKIKFLKKHDPWMKNLFQSQKVIDSDTIDKGVPGVDGTCECQFEVINYPACAPDWQGDYEIVIKNCVKKSD